MSVLIMGMEMPTNCLDCHFTDDHSAVCKLLNLSVYFKVDKRHEDCPLVPVPKHGDLTDRKELIKSDHLHYEYMSDEFYVTVRDIECAPTIIPADKEAGE